MCVMDSAPYVVVLEGLHLARGDEHRDTAVDAERGEDAHQRGERDRRVHDRENAESNRDDSRRQGPSARQLASFRMVSPCRDEETKDQAD
jgi:hypothetical protein